MSQACCQRHLRALMESYSSLLAPGGWLVTAEPGASDNCWSQFGLRMTKPWPGVYKLTL